ncbi:AraC family transcriptional regulator [Pseudomonas daroniae]|uniref:AraC family transcriptional regulator n=1 Tax=Phytopseudomonas daroniae TaxID=2487519 RepID=A0A4Q9QN21_9GAMM|nr:MULTISPECIES: helix-turn-helix domain-containing protein [Pseudomonas]TBU78869.1 AraC family transcriptional regulator [Pseudomonas daroniae]TBU81191.1 AraC family transcriptional regulator [Pseudomonas daroniae]TBU83715.1 AraC family transcriptional regulator [Pseudomonas sp. FRB 228]TBU89352.1 AraC family transcriptional regulator [Pseudomonas daroniae]
MYACNCCSIPTYKIRDFGDSVKSATFDFARMQHRMNILPYPHRHDFFHVIWVTQGSGTHVIDSVRYCVKPNTLFFMMPGQIHDFELSDDTAGYNLNFSAEYFLLNMRNDVAISDIPFFRMADPIQALYLTDEVAIQLQRVIDRIEEEYRGERTGYHDIIRSYLHIFFLHAARLISVTDIQDHASPNIVLARRFRKLLEKEPITLVSAGRFASMLHITERRLSEATKVAEGLTATEVIQHRLALEAKRLLAHSEFNIATVATRLGFDDPAYFSRFFRKKVGLSPSEFKRSMHADEALNA